MAKLWLPIILIIVSIISHEINGDTYHYRVLRKICPRGSYHDPIRDKCRRLPGGGELIKLNLDAKCSNGFTGLLPYDKKSRYYFVCKSDAVLTCACKPKETFNRVRLRCEGRNRKSSHETHEKFTGTVVDNILEKYRCTLNNGRYENGKCLMSTPNHSPSTDCKTPEISKLQNLLNYLRVLKTLTHSSEEIFRGISHETPSLEVLPRPRENPFLIAFRNFIKSFAFPKIIPRPEVFQSDTESELKDWMKNWGIDEELVESSQSTTEEPKLTSKMTSFKSFLDLTTKEPKIQTSSFYETQSSKQGFEQKRTSERFLEYSTQSLDSTTSVPVTEFYSTTEAAKLSSTTNIPSTTLELTTEQPQSTFNPLIGSTTEDTQLSSTTSFYDTSESSTLTSTLAPESSTQSSFEESTTESSELESSSIINESSTESSENAQQTSTTLTPENESFTTESPEDPTTIFDDEFVELLTTTEIPITTVFDSKPSSENSATHKLVMRITDREHTKVFDIGEIDFIDEEHEYMYEYFYEDEPDKVLYTKDIHNEDLPNYKTKNNEKDEDFRDEDEVELEKEETTTFIPTTLGSSTTESFVESTSIIPESSTQGFEQESTSESFLESSTQSSENETSTLAPESSTQSSFEESTTESSELESSSIINESSTESSENVQQTSTTLTPENESSTTESPEDLALPDDEFELESFEEKSSTTENILSESTASPESPLDLKDTSTFSTLETSTFESVQTSTIESVTSTMVPPENLMLMPTESSEFNEPPHKEFIFEYFYEDDPDLFTKDIDINAERQLTTEKSFTESTTFDPQSTTENFFEESTTESSLSDFSLKDETSTNYPSTTESFAEESTTESFADESMTESFLNDSPTSTFRDDPASNYPSTIETTPEISTESIVSLESTTLEPNQDESSTILLIKLPEILTTTESQNSFETTSILREHEIISSSTSSEKPKNPLYWQDPAKKDEIEYYYEYEDYETDESGKPLENQENEKNFSHDGKESIKQRRDNSFEYYVESISASREHRKLNSDLYPNNY